MGRLKSEGTQVPGSRAGRLGKVPVLLGLFRARDFLVAMKIDLMSPTVAQRKTAAMDATTRDDGRKSLISESIVTED